MAKARLVPPFDSYPNRGRRLLGLMKGSNSRHDYARQLVKLTGCKSCAYCGRALCSDYVAWLSIAVDHVVPIAVCEELSISWKWSGDYSNTVVACSACNSFCNQYRPKGERKPETLEAFYDLRDRIFAERKKKILAKHAIEREFFKYWLI